jgi:hypothetical protein
MGKITLIILLLIFALFVGIQFYPVNLTNPPIKNEISAPENVMKILRFSCYDCHSNKTKWPWYNKIAPVSFLIKHDVTKGRSLMNFTEWNQSEAVEEAIKDSILDAVKSGRMPPLIYRLGHPKAKLTEDKITIIENWVKSRPAK